MFDNLIVSKSNATENKRLSGWMTAVMVVMGVVLSLAMVVNIYSEELTLGASEFEVSELVMPVANNEPPKTEPATPKQQQNNTNESSKLPSRIENIQRLDESPVKPPQTTSVTPSTSQARPNAPFTIGKDDTNPAVSNYNAERGNSTNTGDNLIKSTAKIEDDENDKPPVLTEPKKPVEPKTPPIKSGGVVNGKAKNLVKPTYPASAKLVKAAGEVKVQVTIDEEGRVISASAVSGHPLLKKTAVDAARLSTFTPTFLSGQKVKVTGIILYNFN